LVRREVVLTTGSCAVVGYRFGWTVRLGGLVIASALTLSPVPARAADSKAKTAPAAAATTTKPAMRRYVTP